MTLSAVKVALIAGVAGAVVLSSGATAIAATREDPGVMAVSTISDDDDSDGEVASKKGSKDAKGKNKVRYKTDQARSSVAIYSRSSDHGRSQARAAAEAAPRGKMELTRDLLSDGRP